MKLTAARLDELTAMVYGKLSLMYRDPQKYTGDAKSIWSSHFGWSTQQKSFKYDTSGSGDVGTPWLDDDDGWHETHNEMEMERSKAGVESLRFISCDQDGNWDTEAEFTKADISGRSRGARMAREELVKQMLYRHSTYVLLRQALYNIDCVRTGKDSLGWVFAPVKMAKAVVDVTLDHAGLCRATLVSGAKSLVEVAVRYVAHRNHDPREFQELENILKEHPKGRPINTDDRTRGWKLLRHRKGKTATLRVTVKETTRKLTAAYVRKVMSRNLEQEVLALCEDK